MRIEFLSSSQMESNEVLIIVFVHSPLGQGQQNVQIQEMRTELDEMSATHNRMESIVFNLVDDMRDLKGTSRLQYKQFQTVSAELNHKTDKIRHENKKVLDRIRACQVIYRLSSAILFCRFHFYLAYYLHRVSY